MSELTRGRVAGMGDQIYLHLGVTRNLYIPTVGLEGDGVLEQGAGPRATVNPPSELGFPSLEQAVDLLWTNGVQLVLDGGREAEAFPHPWHPEGQ